jgi:hypothetical protein
MVKGISRRKTLAVYSDLYGLSWKRGIGGTSFIVDEVASVIFFLPEFPFKHHARKSSNISLAPKLTSSISLLIKHLNLCTTLQAVFLDQLLSCRLRNNISRPLRMRIRRQRTDAQIHYSQSLHTIDLETRVYNSHGIRRRTHLCCPVCVEFGH